MPAPAPPASAPPATGQTVADKPSPDRPTSDLHRRLRAWMPGPKALLIAAAAFVVGLLLFLVVWLQARHHGEVKTGIRAPQSAEGTQFEPLPAPLPASRSDDNASGMDPDAKPPPRPPEIVDAPPPAVAPGQVPAMPTAQGNGTPVNDRIPQPIRSPPPRYPRSAQRRGQSGTVLLRVSVTAGGSVDRVEILQGSRTRALDRAASDALRRWRFRPAMRGGQPVPGTVEVPITFQAER